MASYKLWLPLLALWLFCFATAQPDSIGAFQDDAIYASSARSLFSTQALRVPILPACPPLTKYPPLTSLVFAAGLTSPALIFAIQALVFCLSLALLLDLYKQLKIPEGPAAFALAIFALHPVTLQIVRSFLSEPSALLILGLQLRLLTRSPESASSTPPLKELLGIALALALAPLSRSALVLHSLGLLATLAQQKRWREALSGGLGLSLGILIQRLLRAAQDPQLQKLEPQLRASLAYYLDYGFHLDYYKNAPAGALLPRLWAVFSHNLDSGLSSLGRLFDPLSPLALLVSARLPSVLPKILGALILSAALLGLWRDRPSRPLLFASLPPLLFFLLWTWPFSQRFWFSLLPILLLGLLALREQLEQTKPRLAAAFFPLGLLLLSSQVLILGAALLPASLVDPAEQRRSQLDQDDLALARERPVLWVGGFRVFQLATRSESPGIWIEAVLPRDQMLERQLEITDPSSPLSAEEASAVTTALAAIAAAEPDRRLILHFDRSAPPWLGALIEAWIMRGQARALSQDRERALFELRF